MCNKIVELYIDMEGQTAFQVFIEPEVQKIFDAFSTCFEIRIAFFTPDGKEQTVGLERPCCDFCTLVREELEKKDTCLSLDSEKRQEAFARRSEVTYRCHSGMTEAVVPIFFDDLHLGYIMIGQFRTGKQPSGKLLDEWTVRKGDPEPLLSAFNRTPWFSPDKEEDIRNLFLVLVDYIVKQRMVYQREPLLLDRVNKYIQEHLHEPIRLSDLAETVGRSVSTLSHIFARVFNKGIKEYIIGIKCEKAKEILKKDPYRTVKEIASAVGYQDQYHFSRIYKKYMGRSPSGERMMSGE